MKRRLVALMMAIVMSFGFAPSALAHDGKHDFWEACRLGGSAVVWAITTIVTKKVAAPANLPPAATTGVRLASTAAAAGSAGGFYDKYGSHAVEGAVRAKEALHASLSEAPNTLFGGSARW